MATEFGILGELQVERDGTPCPLGPPRQRHLLARLLVRANQPIPIERLMDELWPDEPPETARHRLHVHISRLRAVLGDDRDSLTSDASTYRLHVEPEALDASRFVALAADGRRELADGNAARAAARLRAALALWRGPALVEFAEESFACAEAARLDQLRLAVLEDRNHAELSLGHHGELIEELQALTLEQSYREVFWEQLMLALYRAGRQADALRAFGEVRTRLANDLGIEPGPALKRMEQRVLAHDPSLSLETATTAATTAATAAAPDAVAGNLPLQRTSFVGRERDLSAAGELLAASRLLTLTGAPGAGKTRLALRLAQDRARDYPDGTFFVSLASVSESRQLEPAITAALETARAFDSTEQGEAARGSSLGQRLGRRRFLLVLDNLEQVTGAAGPIDQLLDSAEMTTILATSRAPLGVAGEQEFPVSPLAQPAADALSDPTALLEYDAVALLVARARAVDPRLEITAENAAAIAGIVRRLDGLPLAIELGAGRLRVFNPQDLLERLEHRLPLLTAGVSDTVARHHTLREAIAWSYELLSDDEQRLFRRLGPFVGEFTAKAAAVVADQSLDATWQGIEALLSQNLLHRPVDVGEARFAMLQTLREFALEQLDVAGEREVVQDGHARYYLDLAKRAAEGPSGDRADEAIATLSQDVDEIRAALVRCAADGDGELGLRLASETWRVWQATGCIDEGRELLGRLLDPPGPDAVVRADALVALAGLAYWQADWPAAMAAYREALELYRATGNVEGEAETLYGMSPTAIWDGHSAEGARLAAEARVLFESLGARARVGETLMSEAFARFREKEYAASRPLWAEAAAISQEFGSDSVALTALAGVACVEYQAGAFDEATRIGLECLERACELDNLGLCVWMLDFVAAFAVADRPAEAVRVAGAADALRTASGGGMPIETLYVEPARSAAEGVLEPADLEQAWAEGRAMGLQEAIETARSLAPRASAEPPSREPEESLH